MKSKVAVVRCDNYDRESVRQAVVRGIDLLGGAQQFAQPGESILLKPNMLAADPPERCSTTHYSVFRGVAKVFQKAGANLSYGDSPGFGSPEIAAKRCRIAEAASELSIPLADFKEGREVHFEEARQNKKFFLANGALDSDGLISISKLKAHGFAKMTGSVKNQFGCIPGLLKGEFHVKLPNIYDFARMLVDLNLLLKPRLYVMDGIMAMEGNGPRGGKPFPMNVLLFSADPIALDATVCRLIDVDPALVPTIKAGQEAGLGTYLEEEIELVGDLLGELRNSAFLIDRQPLKGFQKNGLLGRVKNAIVPKPYILEPKCVRCGICSNVCPVSPKALDFHDGNRKNPPTYKYDWCIRCYCCQELCPEEAIELKVPLIRRLIGRKS